MSLPLVLSFDWFSFLWLIREGGDILTQDALRRSSSSSASMRNANYLPPSSAFPPTACSRHAIPSSLRKSDARPRAVVSTSFSTLYSASCWTSRGGLQSTAASWWRSASATLSIVTRWPWSRSTGIALSAPWISHMLSRLATAWPEGAFLPLSLFVCAKSHLLTHYQAAEEGVWPGERRPCRAYPPRYHVPGRPSNSRPVLHPARPTYWQDCHIQRGPKRGAAYPASHPQAWTETWRGVSYCRRPKRSLWKSRRAHGTPGSAPHHRHEQERSMGKGILVGHSTWTWRRAFETTKMSIARCVKRQGSFTVMNRTVVIFENAVCGFPKDSNRGVST